MKKSTFWLLFISSLMISEAKGQFFSQWGNLTKGNYAVGYKDTVIFKTDEQFSYYNYKNHKPFFVSVWYPAIDNKKIPFLNFENYMEFPRQDMYGNLYDSLISTFHHILIKDAVSINIKPNGEKVEFDENFKKLYHDILKTKVNAKRRLVEIRKKLPCVFYHHGAQSAPFDNNIFCEYMASHGFVVVSSSYNLPSEGNPNRLTGSTDDKFDDISDMDFVLKFTKRMPDIDSSGIVAVGHSWGAQTEIRFDNINVQKSFRQIISLHTTLEEKPLDLVQKWWPEFNYIYENDCKNSTTPVFFFAPLTLHSLYDTDTVTGIEKFIKFNIKKPKYLPFKLNKTTPYTFITVKHNVRHDGFISLGNLRYSYCQKYHLADNDNILSQQSYYEEIIKFSKKIISASLSNTSTDKILKNKHFIIEKHNQTSKTK